jgi:hypothetical protein
VSRHLEFLRNLQRLLDEGVFTATYKYALLQGLADLSVERQSDSDGALRLPVADIAEKFIQYYWKQTVPYRGADGILHQNAGKQAAIVNIVAESRAVYEGRLHAARSDERNWKALKSKVGRVIRDMPLWKLQVVAKEEIEFLYRRDQYTHGVIRLLPDAVECFRDMYVIVTNFIRGAWATRIQTFGPNHAILGEAADLPQFLFGSDRNSVEKYKKILRDYQQSRCFYCGRIARSGDLDHFVPWVRYPIDLGHNFVFAHAVCNRKKRDFLAHEEHLSRWKKNNLESGDDLAAEFDREGLAHDCQRSEHVARWAYEQGEAAGAHVWVNDDVFEQLGPSWRNIF